MKYGLTLFVLTAVIFISPLNQADVEGSWWDTGIALIKTLGTEDNSKIANSLTTNEIGEAFKEALAIGTKNVVCQLGSNDGFNLDQAIHIQLPEEVTTVKTMLGKIGMSQLTDDLELKLNRAAEAATPKAKELFLNAITEMTFTDVKNIYSGPEDSATTYFKEKMTQALELEMEPIVTKTLSQVGAVQAYDKVIGEYQTLPFVPDIKANLTEHVIKKGVEGIFYYIAKEEAAIRNDPAKQTTAILKKVFGVK